MITGEVAALGAGAMGAGIAQVMAASGMEVVLLDMKTEFVGLKRIASRFESDVKKGRMTADDKARVMGLIKGKRGPVRCPRCRTRYRGHYRGQEDQREPLLHP